MSTRAHDVTAIGPLPYALTAPGAPRHWMIGRRCYPVVPPTIHDSRTQLSMVIVTILFIGTGWLGFRVSIPQLVITIVACGALEAAYTFGRTAMLVWPASALQTGTSTALLFRVVGTENADRWSFAGWYLFVAVGALGLLTKHTIRYRGGHVFNPSNIALVVAFVVLGSRRVEPLDYWWAPLGWAMLAAYAVILGGGLLICRRLRLLGLGAGFWISLTAGIGLLAAAGHSITTRWSFAPVSGAHFWWIIVTSPEILIFLFFMITDPKTVPAGRVARVIFGVAVGVVSTLLIAPWGTEFGAKVGLLSGLVVVTAARPLIERACPPAGSPDDDLRRFTARLLGLGERRVGAPRLALRAASAATATAMLALAITVAGLPARGSSADAGAAPPRGIAAVFEPASLPAVTIDRDVGGLSAHLATPAGAQELAEALVFNLQVESEALSTGDATLLPAVDDGARLLDLEAAIEAATSTGRAIVPTYSFDTFHLVVVFPGGLQRGANAGLVATGTVTEVALGTGGDVLEHSVQPFELTFTLRRTTSGRWLITDTLVPDGE